MTSYYHGNAHGTRRPLQPGTSLDRRLGTALGISYTHWMAFLSMLLLASTLTQATASIEGAVIKMGTGEAIAGATVTLDVDGPINSAGAKTAATGTDGKFLLSNVPPGTYRLIAKR